MKLLGFALPVMALVIAASPRAIASPVSASAPAAGLDVARLNSASGTLTSVSGSGQVTWSGYTFSDSGAMGLSEVVGQPVPAQGQSAVTKPGVGVSTITGSGFFKRSGAKPAIRAANRGLRGAGYPDSSGPEPSSLLLLGTGLLGLAFVVFRMARSSEAPMQK
jgi:hypothetical protein